MPDDLVQIQAKLDEYRAALGIHNGWGMEPGDKGYVLPNMPALTPPPESKTVDATLAVSGSGVPQAEETSQAQSQQVDAQ